MTCDSFKYSVFKGFSKTSDGRSGIVRGHAKKSMSDFIGMDQIYVTLRDERREAAIVAAEKKKIEEDRR